MRKDDWISKLYLKEERKSMLNQEDFYINEKGMKVMTEGYHIRRGSCCGSGCKHCPYSPPYQKTNTTLREGLKQTQLT
jgi:hypothetical protein